MTQTNIEPLVDTGLSDLLSNTLDVPLCKGDWAQDSRRILSYITVCGYDTTHLQENPQRLG